MTIRYARSRARVARNTLVRLDGSLSARRTWTIYPRHCGGVTTTGR